MPPGLQHYTKMVIGRESTAGTAVAGSRLLYPDGTGMFDIDYMLTHHSDANRGTKTHVTHGTSMGVSVAIPFRTAGETGVGFDELVIPFSQIKGGVTGSGGTAAKVWTFTPTQTATSSQESYTLEAGDDNEAWRFEYAQARRWRLSASQDSITQLEIDFFARQPTIASTLSAATATNPVKVVGKRWKTAFATAQSGLNAASYESNFLLDFDLDVTTGLVPRRYLDGNDYFGQSVEGEDLDFTITMHGESTSVASTRYAKWTNQQVEFVRLRNEGASVGSTTYTAQIDLAVLWTSVRPIAAADEGVNVWEFTGRAAYDSTWGNSISAVVVNSVTALPGL